MLAFFLFHSHVSIGPSVPVYFSHLCALFCFLQLSIPWSDGISFGLPFVKCIRLFESKAIVCVLLYLPSYPCRCSRCFFDRHHFAIVSVVHIVVARIHMKIILVGTIIPLVSYSKDRTINSCSEFIARNRLRTSFRLETQLQKNFSLVLVYGTES